MHGHRGGVAGAVGTIGLIVGADIVEVAPAYDHAEITGIAAAHVAYELLSVLALDAEPGTPAARRPVSGKD